MHKYIPFGQRIIVKKLDEQVNSSIVLPSSVETEDKAIGEIVEVAHDALLENVKVGDIIVYNEFAGELIPYEENLLILNVKDILAKRYECSQ